MVVVGGTRHLVNFQTLVSTAQRSDPFFQPPTVRVWQPFIAPLPFLLPSFGVLALDWSI